MPDKIQLGAIDTEDNKYVPPIEAIKGKIYNCIECKNRVILKKGTIRIPHFAHAAQTNVCSYYDHPNESQIHKDAKMLMAKLLTERKRIQFVWKCDYQPCCNTLPNMNEFEITPFQDTPSIMYKEGDEVKLEYRDKDNKWVADVAVVNKGEVRYIIEIKNTHATTTARPEPWYEVNALDLIQYVNEMNRGDQIGPEYVYTIGCERSDIVRYCYGSFCYKERWVNKIPGYDKRLTMISSNCLLCNIKEYVPVGDGCTGRFQKGEIRVCVNCLMNDTYKKELRIRYAEKCYGSCFVQTNNGGYIQLKCPDRCKLMRCSKCKGDTLYPEQVLLAHGGTCINCNYEKLCFIFLDVPYARKDEAKALGAKWDHDKRKWYIFTDETNKASILSKFRVSV